MVSLLGWGVENFSFFPVWVLRKCGKCKFDISNNFLAGLKEGDIFGLYGLGIRKMKFQFSVWLFIVL